MKNKRAMFIDRDGTLIREPAGDFQVDTLEKLEFMPGVFRNLYRIRRYFDYELVIVSNQDGLGTPSYPENDFRKVQDKMIKAFENEDIRFDEVLIDPHFEDDGAPTRKPGTGMLTRYMKEGYDLGRSFVIGDRQTDMQLAASLGCRGIWLTPDNAEKDKVPDKVLIKKVKSWDEIYRYLAMQDMEASVHRKTGETDVRVRIALDGSGESDITTGIGFFDHLLEQIPRHAGCDLRVRVQGDLRVDEHHTIEDTALALGEAFSRALTDKRGMERYGFVLPMDDSRAEVLIDFGGRNWLVWEADFRREKIGEMPTEMFFHFFKSFTDTARCNLQIRATGANEHHKIEAVFKAFARAIRMAVRKDPAGGQIPSTKNTIAP
ncbi:MAG TPA: bifunctional histidinol-phosphatase/imidazoleglycerol-phosphate dehydratase HisB [Bacteroidetes bacterium]|nr:bifunctional histidinol-phosphatase/imidazoleglycerol-phosphate dehydratase HisB [Bacteroidota bacterium]